MCELLSSGPTTRRKWSEYVNDLEQQKRRKGGSGSSKSTPGERSANNSSSNTPTPTVPPPPAVGPGGSAQAQPFVQSQINNNFLTTNVNTTSLTLPTSAKADQNLMGNFLTKSSLNVSASNECTVKEEFPLSPPPTANSANEGTDNLLLFDNQQQNVLRTPTFG